MVREKIFFLSRAMGEGHWRFLGGGGGGGELDESEIKEEEHQQDLLLVMRILTAEAH